MTTETDEQAVWRIRKECGLLQGEHFLENIDDLFEEYARRLLAWQRERAEPVAIVREEDPPTMPGVGYLDWLGDELPIGTKLYAAPPAAQEGRAEPVAWMLLDKFGNKADLHFEPNCAYPSDYAEGCKDVPLYAAPAVPSQDALEPFLKECEAEAAHVEQNGTNLRVKFGDEHEGRCRELCAMYLREFIASYRMGQRIKQIDAAPAAPSQDALDAVFLPRSILVQGPVYLEIGTMKISSRSLMEAIDAAMLERKGS